MLTFNLKKEWYEKIRRGEKTIEYREMKPYWTKRLYPLTLLCPKERRIKDDCILRLGYTKKYMTARIAEIHVMNGRETDLHIDQAVYAIYLEDIKEVGI